MRKKTLRALKKRQFTRLCILYDLYTILMRSAQYIWFVHQVKKSNLRIIVVESAGLVSSN